MGRNARRAAQRRGRRAERLAACWLQLKGYRILGRQLRLGVGEIDLVARRGRTLAIVEVKQRPTLAAAAEAIRPKQRQRIARAAAAYLIQNPAGRSSDIRFDALLLAPWRLPRHIKAAWE
ncbi:MAG: YraN family protein [Rhodospirillales bacterium]|nr:YraN family protein [Rhodospirillales bacterium]